MNSRIDLHNLLCEVAGSKNVYFQPPSNVHMNYPAIIYVRDDISSEHANNGIYMQSHSYKITVVDKDPCSKIVDRVARLPRSRFGTHFVADGLNHDIFYIYY